MLTRAVILLNKHPDEGILTIDDYEFIFRSVTDHAFGTS